jgi:hypothetical protein
MRNNKGHVSGSNGQLVVTRQQVIAGAMLSQHPVGRTLLHPLLDQCRGQLAAAGIRPKLRTVLAGSGYVTEDNFTRAEEQHCGCSRRWAKILPPTASATPLGAAAWPSCQPPHGPSGGCATTAAAPATSSAPRPLNQCSGRSKPARR